MSDGKPARPSAQEVLNLLTVAEWQRLGRYLGLGSDWAWAVSSCIDQIAKFQATRNTRNHMEPGYDTQKPKCITTDFEAWFKTQHFAEDYAKMLERAFDAGAAQAMNYIADDPQDPQLIEFAGGRTVQIIKTKQDVPILVVSRRVHLGGAT